MEAVWGAGRGRDNSQRGSKHVGGEGQVSQPCSLQVRTCAPLARPLVPPQVGGQGSGSGAESELGGSCSRRPMGVLAVSAFGIAGGGVEGSWQSCPCSVALSCLSTRAVVSLLVWMVCVRCHEQG